MDMKGCVSLIMLYREAQLVAVLLNLEADKNALNKNAKICFRSRQD